MPRPRRDHDDHLGHDLDDGVSGADPYDVLGVPPGASLEEIHVAYVRLARRHHPDYFVDAPPAERAAAERRMQALNEAWAVLANPVHRQALEAERRSRFEPFEPIDDDEPDPRDAPDIPYRQTGPPTGRQRATLLAPVALFATSVGIGILGAVLRIGSLLAIAAVVLALSCVAFVAVPMLALTRARRDE